MTDFVFIKDAVTPGRRGATNPESITCRANGRWIPGSQPAAAPRNDDEVGRRNARKSQRGLTLPELLIALLVFAMISGAAVYALRLSVEGREQLEAADARLRELQIARLIIKEDLLTIAFRTVRDEFGNTYPGPFIGGRGLSIRRPQEGEELLLAFVRRGWDNPDAASPRSTLQAVEYLRVRDTLVRRVRPYLDDARGQKRIDRVLLSGVTAASIGFFVDEVNGRLNWLDAWPPRATAGAPEAVRLTLSTERYGEIEQLFWIGELSP